MQYKPIMYLTENMRSRPDSSFDSPYTIKYAPAHYAFQQPPAFKFAQPNANFKMGAVTHGVEPPSAMMSIARTAGNFLFETIFKMVKTLASSLFPAFRFGGGDDEAGDGAQNDPTMNFLQPGGFNYGAGYNGI